MIKLKLSAIDLTHSTAFDTLSEKCDNSQEINLFDLETWFIPLYHIIPLNGTTSLSKA